MIILLYRIFSVFIAVLLTACGGGGGGFTGTDTGSSTGSTTITSQKILISTTQITVKSDNSDSATITAIALDANNVVVPGVTITFTTSAGQLSIGSVITDISGKATVIFSSGNDSSNAAPATITASALDSHQSTSIPILIIGTTIKLDTVSSNLEKDIPITLMTTIKNAAEIPIFGAKIDLSVTGTGSASFDKSSGISNVNGQFEVQLTPTSVGNITVTAIASGTTATMDLIIFNLGATFQITSPQEISLQGDSHPPTQDTEKSLPVIVNTGDALNVTFVTSLGNWLENGSQLLTISPHNGIATATLISTQSGTASVRAFDSDHPSIFDVTTILFAASADRADNIVLQSNLSTMLPSVGGAIRPAELTAIVYTNTNEPVANAPVVFSLSNTTNSGEILTPIYGITDAAGRIKSTFTSGSLSSGSAGVGITATVYGNSSNPIDSDSVQININQTAGSVVIGASTLISDENASTSYTNALTVMVTDSAGSAVPNAVISLTAWPTYYSTGFWVADAGKNCVENITNTMLNEDINENLILDPGEDFNMDGHLTPPNSAAGAIPSTVTTDENGVANFSITYLKKYAVWTTTRIRAKTLVLGSETTGELSQRLAVTISDAEACLVFDSPFIANGQFDF